ncbi:TlpA family protein disulfide reductase [Shouchella clausii]|uniref:TlpA family protein disulfide reductase n=1 Tax=Shouchella clausii TaxID=79880 RepID=UPI000BA6CFD7|nr:TlpA disulfide reductase family protein [Shouchella clausii]PAD90720.1 hypothetical protein CHH52_18715 [Shouchella clausii]
MIRSIRRSILLFILVAAILAVGWFHFKTESIFRHVEAIVHAMEEGVQEGKAAPTFALPTLSGGIGEFNPKKGAHRYTMVHFFATWCYPCQEEMPLIVEAEKRLSQQGDHFVAVNLTSEEKGIQEVKAFLTHFNAPFDPLLDKEGDIQEQYQIFGIPTTLVVDREGRIVRRINGAMDEGMLTELPPFSVADASL